MTIIVIGDSDAYVGYSRFPFTDYVTLIIIIKVIMVVIISLIWKNMDKKLSFSYFLSCVISHLRYICN